MNVVLILDGEPMVPAFTDEHPSPREFSEETEAIDIIGGCRYVAEPA